MSKGKAAICTAMFYVLVFTAYIAINILSEPVFSVVQSLMCGALMYWWSATFYRWLTKKEDSP